MTAQTRSVRVLSASLVAAVAWLGQPAAEQSSRVTIRAARLIDGRGQSATNQVVTISGAKIERVAAGTGAVTYDLAR